MVNPGYVEGMNRPEPEASRAAEERGAARVREQLRAVVAEHTRIVKVGGVTVEVVAVAALDEVLHD